MELGSKSIETGSSGLSTGSILRRIASTSWKTAALVLMPRAKELAALLMENSAASLRATKLLLNEHARQELDAQIESAIRENAAIRSTADFREGISAFLEKRKPVWTGK